MTYGLGLLADAGLVMIADTRTNGGVDNVSSYRKLHRLVGDGERDIFAASCGNLSATQAAIALLVEKEEEEEAGERLARPLAEARSMFQAARIAGEALRRANGWVSEALAPARKAGSCLLLGGRIGDAPPRLFLIYEEGNFIECKPDAPFLQIGETKYGRPILDRVVRRDMALPALVKIGLLSFDSAMRSNLSVARPLDLVVVPAAADEAVIEERIGEDDAYFDALSARWSRLLGEGAAAIPDPWFMSPGRHVPAAGSVARLRP
ncbi:peptidase [Sphingosinicella terrae]|uniref:peptidase n=1 Tax=Sphingosinicella terrae TaxID=2172047 RepID=UPI000E0DAADD|nr:peptidase [Sphingosinicella terrae]